LRYENFSKISYSLKDDNEWDASGDDGDFCGEMKCAGSDYSDDEDDFCGEV